MTKVAGGCHCGAVRFEAEVEGNAPELLDFNCSICRRTAFLHLIIAHKDFVLISGAPDLTSYKFGSGRADHLFCTNCGIKSFYQPRSHPDSWSVNYNCLDLGHRLKPRIIKFDGQNWEAAKAHLAKTDDI